MNPLKHIKLAHTRFDHQVTTELARKEIKVTCFKGCHAYCSEALYVLADEAKHIMKSIPSEELPGVIERTKTWLERAKSSGMLDIEIPHVFAYRQARLVCPLLKDGLCLVYAHRPLGCRSHCAVGDPKLCDDDHTRLEQKFVNIYEYLRQCRRAMMAGSKQPVTGDHLGVFLARKFLGADVCSKSQIVAEE